MPVIYATPVKTVRMTATRDFFANGTMEILSASNAVLAIFGLPSDGGSVSGAIWSFVPDDTEVNGEAAAGAGVNAAKARLKNSAGTASLTGLTVTATGGGGDVQLINLSISSGQPVRCESASITHAADPA